MKKTLIAAICIPILIFAAVVAYWTALPRTATLDIPGEGIYTGDLRGMTFHGFGKYVSYEIGGTSYEGEWKNGGFYGQGTLTFANASKLVGEFVDGSIDGLAKTICPDGHVKEVDFSGDEPVSLHTDCDHDH